jgi:hypothetical protein
VRNIETLLEMEEPGKTWGLGFRIEVLEFVD